MDWSLRRRGALLAPESEPLLLQVVLDVVILLLEAPKNDRRPAGGDSGAAGAGWDVAHHGKADGLGHSRSAAARSRSGHHEVVLDGEVHDGAALEVERHLRQLHRLRPRRHREAGAEAEALLHHLGPAVPPSHGRDHRRRHRLEHRAVEVGERRAGVDDGASPGAPGDERPLRQLHALPAHRDGGQSQVVVDGVRRPGARAPSQRGVLHPDATVLTTRAAEDQLAADGGVVVEPARQEAVGELGEAELGRHRRRAAAETGEAGRRLVHGRQAAADDEVPDGAAGRAQRVGDEQAGGGS
ncbi:Os04g0685151 [Oryza sativa Japonica Group]|uniref:Os04g0685151 protein n=1 Tax=Oryza sativa subsp. japonica TaxID=39947 RepID=A0A0P0WGK8_ORYSJ|nr:hypothetical protein EE612_026365 [Oryza sativa]BAS91724.1 Os04g0685151 [Oryza sativa Japonica Group]